jgi:cytosine/uracil/thiamine/allantoin permease
VVACGWFGVQTWIGGGAIYAIYNALTGVPMTEDLSVGRFACFGIFWLLNMYFIWKGSESIKWLEEFSAPILVLIGVALIGWGAYQGGGFGRVLTLGKQLESPSAVWAQKEGNHLEVRLSPFVDENGKPKAERFRLAYPVAGGQTDTTDWQALDGRLPKVLESVSWPGYDGQALLKGGGALKAQFNAGTIHSSWVAVAPDTGNKGMGFMGYLVWLTAMVGFWATMSLSISDITRFAKSQNDQIKGQFIGLPGTMVLYSFVGIFVTFAAVLNFGDVLTGEDAPWDPVALLAKFDSPWVVVFSQVFMLIATLSTNIAANVIAPANAFSNLMPKQLSFRGGGLVTGVIGILICPWWLMGQIAGLLMFVSGLLGPVLGIMLCDYFIVRKTELSLPDLYDTQGAYAYQGGFNMKAMLALAVGVLVALLGFWFESVKFLYDLSWFTGFGAAFAAYYLLMKRP